MPNISGGFSFSLEPENADIFVVVVHVKLSKSSVLETDLIERNLSERNKTNLCVR